MFRRANAIILKAIEGEDFATIFEHNIHKKVQMQKCHF